MRQSAIALVGAFIEQNVDYVKRDRSASDDYAGGHSSPENVGAGKLPDSQQRREDRYEYAGARRPEGERPNSMGIEIAPSLRTLW